MPEGKEDLSIRSKRYSSLKYALTIIDTLYLVLLLILSQWLGISAFCAKIISNSIGLSYLVFPAYLLVIFLLYYLLTFPLNLYHSFILEHKFSLSNQKFPAWLSDQLKTFLLSYVISLIIFSAFYFILGHNPHTWWMIVSLFWIFFSLILARLMPILIIPLFFKYKTLNDDTLKNRILKLSEKMKVKILDVFEIDFSKKTQKANAAFVGWGKSRRVILADTLKNKYSYDEIEVILAHEFAHYRLKHLLKLILISSLTTILAFFLIFKTSSFVLSLFGLVNLNDIAAFPIVILYLAIFGVIMQPLENFLSRRFEYAADREAIKITGLKDAFISMMNKLADQNLADRDPHPVIKFFFFDHPPINERLDSAK